MKFIMILQLIISIGLINVWLFRFNKATEYRGSTAQNMKEEFIAYGLPEWSMYLVGFLKVAIAIMLIVSIWVEVLLLYNLIVLAGLMTAATFASAERIIGVTGTIALIDASGSETEGTETDTSNRSASVDNQAEYGSIYLETVRDNGITLGIEMVPFSADVSDKVHSRTDTSQAGSGEGRSGTTVNTAAAEIENYRTVYVELPGDTVFIETVDTVYVELPQDTLVIELPPDTITIIEYVQITDTLEIEVIEYIYLTDTIVEIQKGNLSASFQE